MTTSPLIRDLLNQLKQSEFFTEAAKLTDRYISNLICPACGEKEAFVYVEAPFKIHCNRKNNCGAQTDMSTLFCVVTPDFETDYAPTEDDPHRPATEYLKYRGLEKSLVGLAYAYRQNVRGTDCGAAMFPINGPDGTVYNGRLFNPPAGEGKTHNEGATSGSYWSHPHLDYKSQNCIYLTEGIIDALSLIEMGKPAIAILSANSHPAKFTTLNYKKVVLAFDNDPAGQKATRAWSNYINDQTGKLPVAILPLKGDWNDLLQSGPPEKAAETFDKNLTRFEIEGQLARAENHSSYGHILWRHKHYTGLFEYDGQLYKSWTKTVGQTVELKVVHIGNFTVQVEHYQLNATNPEKPENVLYLKVKGKNHPPQWFTASAQELASPNAMKQLFLERTRNVFKGDTNVATDLLEMLCRKPKPVVRQLFLSGYDHASGSYVHRSHMINPAGELITPDHRGFFKVGPIDFIRPAKHGSIFPATSSDVENILDLMFQAWGNNARTGLAWLLACFFVNQIKQKIGFFPFLSFYGDTQTGKSTLVKLLNAFQCVDEEGLPMRKANTAKGEIRTIAQRSGMFTALLEWPPEATNVRFDLENILTLFNDNPLQVRARKTNDLELERIPFYGSFLFAQNSEPFIEKKHKERVVSLQFQDQNLTDETRAAADRLLGIPLSDKAAFYARAMSHRVMIENTWHEHFQAAAKALAAFGFSSRIQETHGLVLGFYRIAAEIFDLEYDLQPFIVQVAGNKQLECSQDPETVAHRYLDILLNLAPSDVSRFMDMDDNVVFIHRTEADKHIHEMGYILNCPTRELTQSIRQHPNFLKNNQPHRFADGVHKACSFSLEGLMACAGSTDIQAPVETQGQVVT